MIASNIEAYKKSISDKTYQGRKLAENLRKDVPNDLVGKDQRFHIFIEKMSQLQKSEARRDRKRKQALARMKASPLTSMAPLKICLAEYSKMTVGGFDCHLLAKSLGLLNAAISSRGNKPRLWSDYALHELDTSWRFEKVLADIKFGLGGSAGDDPHSVFFSAANMADVSRQLGELGYKNTELLPLWFAKIDAMLADKYVQDSVSFEQAVFGGMKGFVPRHYIYRGFENDEEFREHLQTLIDWKTSPER